MSTEPLKLVAACAGSDDLALHTVSRAASYSRPTALAGCYTPQNQVAIAFGCEDGSIFSFVSPIGSTQIDRQKTPSIRVPSESQVAATRRSAPLSAPHPRRAASPELTHRPLSPSALSLSAFSTQSSSGTHTPNPLALPSRSRATQPGISRASIEAPKAHIDVGDEPGKLRAMLAKGSAGKPRRMSLGSVESLEGRERKSGDARGPMSLARSVVDIAFGGAGVRASAAPGSSTTLPVVENESGDEVVSVVSPTLSESTLAGAATIKTGLDLSQIKFELRSHVLPGHGGAWEAVTGLEAIGDQDMYICLQASGTLSLLSVVDGFCLSSTHADDLPRLNPPHGYKSADSVLGSWEWVKLSMMPYIESMIIMIAAKPHPESVTTRVTHSRVAVYKIPEFNLEAVPDPATALEKVGEWLLEADANTVGFVAGYNGLMLTYLNAHGHAILAPLNMLPPPPEPEPEQTPKPEAAPGATAIGAIPIPNPFKAFKPRDVAKPLVRPQNRDGRLLFGTEKDLGLCWDWTLADQEDEVVQGMRIYGEGVAGGDVLVLVWTAMRVLGYTTEIGRDDLKQCFETQAEDVRTIHLSSINSFVVMRQRGIEKYKLRKTDPNGDPSSDLKQILYHCDQISSNKFQVEAQLVDVVPLLGHLCAVTTGQSTPESPLTIGIQNIDQETKRNEKAWESRASTPGVVETTAILPVDADSIFTARSDGQLYRIPLSELVSGPTPQAAEDILGARVTKLWIVTEEYSKELFLLGAVDDGGIACWNARTLQLVARWTIFITELESVVSLSIGDDRLGRLKGCVMAIAAGGTIAVIVLDGMSLLCVIPGSPAPIDRICVGGDNLLLFYSQGLARLWDMKTHEFWRSMQQNKGEELLEQGGWFEVPIGRWEAPRPIHTLGSLQNNVSSPDAAGTLIMDISSIVDLAKDGTTRRQVVQILAALSPCGLDSDVDGSCKSAFADGQYGKVALGLISERFGASSVVVSSEPAGVWKVSSRYTAMRLLSIVALLRSALNFEEHEQRVSAIISFYVGCLADVVGSEFQPPSLGILASFWVCTPDEVRQAARTIFESRLAQMNETEVVQCVSFWREHLPILQPLESAHSPLAVRALIVCGVIAAVKHSLLPTVYVTDIAKSIALYLHDEAQAINASYANRILSIELCSRGFQVWQHHVDAMEMLRALFGFAVATAGVGKGGKEARAAVLQIAASSTPLFMTTLSLDITQPKTVEHRRATMQLVAFIVRKKPLVLYPNLPRLVEAVIRSLDPNSSGRDAIMDAATEILAEVVRIYPSVDFHMSTQKLAVGTPEGAVILYDLKTATRLYVLEGHARRLTVLSFSPDGRRLATASLEESVVMVWKVGASFTTWFTPGAPPRQGHGHDTSEPYKRLDFNVGDEGKIESLTYNAHIC
ncbi:WD40 domain protein [Ceratobasidium sp. AG-Ba]|nr:WD40 domain protein [Ceratobasidium sp. AG-Ba]